MTKILSQEEVDALLRSQPRDGGPGRRGGPPRKVTPYNFRRPDRVSREQMRSLHFMHDRFARNFSSSLSAYLRTITEVNLRSIEQLSYQDFLGSVPDPTCFNAISIRPLEGALALEVNPSLVFPVIDKLLGGPGEPLKQMRTMTDIEQSIFEAILKLLLEDLRECWRGIVDLDFRIQARETSPQLIQIVAPNEVVLRVGFDARMGPISGMINLAVPSLILEPIASKFDQEMFTGYKKSAAYDEARLLMGSLKRCPMEAAAEIHGAALSLEEVLRLKAGDLIPLPRRADADMDLCVDGVPRFRGQLAVDEAGKRVFQVTGSRAKG